MDDPATFYRMNDDGTVVVRRMFFVTKAGQTFVMDVPLPNLVDDDPRFLPYMRALMQRAMPQIRGQIKKSFGTTKFRLARSEDLSLPAGGYLAATQRLIDRNREGND